MSHEGIAQSLTAEELLFQLVECVDKEPDSGYMGENGDPISAEVLLELDINGYQYTLTRSNNQSPEQSVHLSPREQEVARLVSKGLSNRAIAAVLEISPWTVSTHLRRIYNKLSVGSRAEMVACVMKEGILDLHD